jgi:hypothetical protein
MNPPFCSQSDALTRVPLLHEKERWQSEIAGVV